MEYKIDVPRGVDSEELADELISELTKTNPNSFYYYIELSQKGGVENITIKQRTSRFRSNTLIAKITNFPKFNYSQIVVYDKSLYRGKVEELVRKHRYDSKDIIEASKVA